MVAVAVAVAVGREVLFVSYYWASLSFSFSSFASWICLESFPDSRLAMAGRIVAQVLGGVLAEVVGVVAAVVVADGGAGEYVQNLANVVAAVVVGTVAVADAVVAAVVACVVLLCPHPASTRLSTKSGVSNFACFLKLMLVFNSFSISNALAMCACLNR